MHLQTVTEILQSIRQAEMTPMLQRIYSSQGGPELCDTLMKYLYKGMAQGAPAAGQGLGTPKKNMTPQQTGFSQVGSRAGGGEGQGHGMSVLLSWHEKVCCYSPGKETMDCQAMLELMLMSPSWLRSLDPEVL